MQIINTDTNAIVGGYPIPVGSFEFLVEGNVGVLTTSGGSTNFGYIGAGDTLVIWPSGAALQPGVDAWSMFLMGLGTVFICMLGYSLMRKGLGVLVWGPSRTDF